MKFALRLLALGALLCVSFAAPAYAQYMFLDTNGDGMHTSADVMNPNGTPTVADVYLITNQNRDLSTATCITNDGELTMNSYIVALLATGGTVTYGGFTNAVASFDINVRPLGSNTTELQIGYASGTSLPPGKYKLGTVTITGATGAPAITIPTTTTLSPDPTSFGTACTATEFDNTYKLGLDWSDADGLPAAAGGNASPEITAPATSSGTEGIAITPLVATAVDADPADVLTISTLVPLPSGLTLATTPSTGTVVGTISGTPDFDTQGTHTITWLVSDGTNPPDTARTVLTIGNADRAPLVTAPANSTIAVGSPLSIVVTATDPDSDVIIVLSGSPLPTGATFTANDNNTSGTLTWTPIAGQAGSYDITFTASNALSGSASTHIDVTSGGDTPPSITAISDVNVAENATVNVPVSASDPDNDVITLTAELPAFATLNAPTSGTGSVSTSITVSPGVGTSGSYPARVIATANGVSDSTTFNIVVGGSDQAPVVTAPLNLSGAEGTLVNFSISVTDPNGDPITSLVASPLPAGAQFTPDGTNTGGTFSWTPDANQSGTYSVTFTASNSLSGTATTNITIANLDHAPVLSPIGDITIAEGATLTIDVVATDADSEMIDLTADLPPFGTLNPPTSGVDSVGTTITLSPAPGSAGTYSASVTATANGVPIVETFTITVTGSGADQAPVVTAPANVSGTEGVLTTFTVTASDPNGDAITSLTASPLPTGASFTANASNTAGTFSWTPDATQSGTYDVTFTASNALSGSATTHLTISEPGADQAPVVTAPATVSGDENTLVTFTVTASDPDGDAITSLTASPLPTGATFTANGTNTAGTFSWTPSFTQAGPYSVTFTATNALSGSATTTITIGDTDRPVSVDAIADVTVAEGASITVNVSASDPDGDAITLTSSLPSFATLNPPTTGNGNVSTTITIAPGPGDAGTYTASVTATANGTSDTETFTITVTGGGGANENPDVTAPATQTVNEGQLLTFTVTATDPDGDHVNLSASGLPSGATFVDNGNNTGTFTWTPNSTQSGTYTVTFTGNDGNGGTDTATTVITVNDVTGGAFTATARLLGNFNPHRRYLCFHVKPVNGSFDIHDTDLSSLELVFNGQTLDALVDRTHIDTDCEDENDEECEECGDRTAQNGDCAATLHVCFLTSDVVDLFGDQNVGDNLANATITGGLSTGGTFTTTIGNVKVVGKTVAQGNRLLKSKARPNPLNPTTMLSFTLPQQGRVRVDVYDAQGRLVKSLLNEARIAGEHLVPWDGSDSRGGKVASGVYFFRIETQSAREIVRVTVLK